MITSNYYLEPGYKLKIFANKAPNNKFQITNKFQTHLDSVLKEPDT